ncbi:hypothetical protein CPB83DRAFT_880547 [Crepidotus variabilis]|uniref:Nucleolus and neural progenitor protein-like N-terminal domain-containing protein n=1 Tax=Crepidotus variabilis TaxID=179855 RepID=A0A9P6JUJ8_9AGAR|nr:hypothetical protein CPB83DRAFT_880547 [Crepidotus variabilis]
MTEQTFSRASIQIPQHALVDGQLKTLKLAARRLQLALSTQETELQILKRLIYRNKNQHRGAFFWRSVLEMRRYAGRVAKLKLSDAVISLRSSFFSSSSLSGSSMKGSWTHFPHRDYLAQHANLFCTAQTLADKMSEANLRAYTSFHASLQSAAFLHLMLVFVGISSRLRAVALELKAICHDAVKCLAALQDVNIVRSTLAIFSSRLKSIYEEPHPNHEPPLPKPLEEQFHSVELSESLFQDENPTLPMDPLELQPPNITTNAHPSAQEVQIKLQKRLSEKTDSLKDLPKKKKRKNEIDDIFGF